MSKSKPDSHQTLVASLVANKADDKAAPKIQFPCAYPIKVLGTATAAFEDSVLTVFEQFVAEFDTSSMSGRESNKGTFRSLTITITATGAPQLEALHRALMAIDDVKMVL